MKYAIYARSSSEESTNRQLLSIPGQLLEIKDLCDRHEIDYANTDIFTERKSARKPGKRKIFMKLMALVEKGKYDCILCWHENRLARNAKDAGWIMYLIAEGNLRVITPRHQFDNESNETVMAILFGMGGQYSKEISQNTKKTFKVKLSNGQYPKKAPLFYKNVGEKPNRSIEPDESTRKIFLKWIDSITSERLTLSSAVERLYKLGIRTDKGKKVAKSTVHHLLHNPVYYGYFYWKNELYKGSYEPLLSKPRWDELQEVLNSKAKPNQSRWNHPYTKLATCNKCGLSVTGTTKRKNGKLYTYYHCTRNSRCGNPRVTETNFENYLRQQLERLNIDSDEAERLKGRVQNRIAELLRTQMDISSNLSDEIRKVEHRLGSLLDLRIEDKIEQTDYESKRKEIRKELLMLREQESNAPSEVEITNAIELFFDTCTNIGEVFDAGDEKHRRQLINIVADKVELKNKSICMNYRKPYEAMILAKSTKNRPDWGGLRDSILNPEPETFESINMLAQLIPNQLLRKHCYAA